MSEDRKEIPASEFDFSTIKAGDEIVLRCKVARDGVDRDGYIFAFSPKAGIDHFLPEAISSVIPAPKPKTLRERAIEAAMKADKGAVLPLQVDYADLVDAILAEVEKGQ